MNGKPGSTALKMVWTYWLMGPAWVQGWRAQKRQHATLQIYPVHFSLQRQWSVSAILYINVYIWIYICIYRKGVKCLGGIGMCGYVYITRFLNRAEVVSFQLFPRSVISRLPLFPPYVAKIFRKKFSKSKNLFKKWIPRPFYGGVGGLKMWDFFSKKNFLVPAFHRPKKFKNTFSKLKNSFKNGFPTLF